MCSQRKGNLFLLYFCSDWYFIQCDSGLIHTHTSQMSMWTPNGLCDPCGRSVVCYSGGIVQQPRNRLRWTPFVYLTFLLNIFYATKWFNSEQTKQKVYSLWFNTEWRKTDDNQNKMCNTLDDDKWYGKKHSKRLGAVGAEGFIEMMTCVPKCAGSKERGSWRRKAVVWGKSIPGRENSKYKGLRWESAGPFLEL